VPRVVAVVAPQVDPHLQMEYDITRGSDEVEEFR
jgi:hypothetical protein